MILNFPKYSSVEVHWAGPVNHMAINKLGPLGFVTYGDREFKQVRG